MTAQSSDYFKYNGEFYSIKEINWIIDDFKIRPLGLKPNRGGWCTGCWAGYNWGYAIIDNIVYRNYLTIYDSEARNIAINGIYPTIRMSTGYSYDSEGKETKHQTEDTPEYENLRISTNANGKIIIARDFDFKYYVHMGWQTIKGYNKVFELEFKDGILVGENDVSDIVKQYRKYDKKKSKLFGRGDFGSDEWNEEYNAKENFDLDLWWLKTNNWRTYHHEKWKEERKQKQLEHEEWLNSLTEEELTQHKIEKEKQLEEFKELFWNGDY